MLRGIAGVIAGLVAAWLPVALTEVVNRHLWPPPAGVDMRERSEMFRYVATLPTAAFVLVLGGWLVGTLLGAWLAAKIGRSPVPAYILGAILVTAGIVNTIVIPQPHWFSAISFVIYIGGTLAGARAGRITS